MRGVEVHEPGWLTTVQDSGRLGRAALGVSVSGAADRRSFRLANRLVGNPEDAAALEVTAGGLAVQARGNLTVALTGAVCPVSVAGRQGALHAATALPDGAKLRLGAPKAGLRTYLAVRGGIDVRPVLGSCSTDTLAGLGPEPLRAGDLLPVGRSPSVWPPIGYAPVPLLSPDELELRAVAGPRLDWFTEESQATLFRESYQVTAESNRIGMRLAGPPLVRTRTQELPSEGMVRGAIQIPPSGQPTLLLADHPVTGGYPVAGVVLDADTDLAAQARPGQGLRFRLIREEISL